MLHFLGQQLELEKAKQTFIYLDFISEIFFSLPAGLMPLSSFVFLKTLGSHSDSPAAFRLLTPFPEFYEATELATTV